ncbi:hypothetical protein LINPERHAP2_LOCUS4044 [Linum perenne]
MGVRFSRDGRREVKGLAPPPLVNICDQVVEGVDKVRDFVGGFYLFGAAEEGPVSFVVVLNLVGGD